jgi:hypothetical protein
MYSECAEVRKQNKTDREWFKRHSHGRARYVFKGHAARIDREIEKWYSPRIPRGTTDSFANRELLESLSAVRRFIVDCMKLDHNWDNEGAEAISLETVTKAIAVINHAADVLKKQEFSDRLIPSVHPFPDGSIFFKWIVGQKELTITVLDGSIEAQRWEPLDAFVSEGLWEISIDDIPEHVEWVLI